MPIHLFNPSLTKTHEAEIFEGSDDYMLVILDKDKRIVFQNTHEEKDDCWAELLQLMEEHKWSCSDKEISRVRLKGFEEFYDNEVF